ncbi:MAG TPA: hypothetical protein VGG88_03700, partial [Gaiellaceae bacterium]
SEDEEVTIVREQQHGHPLEQLRAVVSSDDLAALRAAAEDVYVDDLLDRWAVRFVRATRALEEVEVGASVRGSLALVAIARAYALVHGRSYVVPRDVETLFVPVLGHRLLLAPSYVAEMRGASRDEIFERIQSECIAIAPAPQPDWVHDEAGWAGRHVAA